MFSGYAQELLFANSVDDKGSVQSSNLYPIEFLNTLILSFTPPHKLILKVGIPIMLLRNLSPTNKGLCNSTQKFAKTLS